MLRFLLRGVRLEARSDAGRVNALLIVASTLLVACAGMPNGLEQLISIWSDDYNADFPIVPVLGILVGGGLICVFLLVLIEPLLQRRGRDR